MWIPQSIVDEVDYVASVYYVDFAYAQRWNTYRKDNELRMLSGWAWVSKHGAQYHYGFQIQNGSLPRCMVYHGQEELFANVNDTGYAKMKKPQKEQDSRDTEAGGHVRSHCVSVTGMDEPGKCFG